VHDRKGGQHTFNFINRYIIKENRYLLKKRSKKSIARRYRGAERVSSVLRRKLKENGNLAHAEKCGNQNKECGFVREI
jgi:hypothetical protein